MSEHTSHAAGAVGHGPEDTSHGGIGKYIAVFIALCVLTLMSFWTYADFPVRWPFHDQPGVGRVFMMGVSCTKALLVILFFMHVKYEANWKYVLTIPAGMMSIFLMLMLVPDVGMRMRHASAERRLYAAQDAEGETPPTPAAGQPAAHDAPGAE